MNVSATLAWRYLRGRPGRTVLTTLAIVFGVTLIFGLNGMMPSLIDVFNRMLFSSAGQVDMSVTSTSGGTFDPSVADPPTPMPGAAGRRPPRAGGRARPTAGSGPARSGRPGPDAGRPPGR